MPEIQERRAGVLSSWRLSKSGGFGMIFVKETGQSYFICKNLIVSGVPVVGSEVSFIPGPTVPGKTCPQALSCRIDNRKIIRALTVPGQRGRRTVIKYVAKSADAEVHA
jgi:hypothetical protein